MTLNDIYILTASTFRKQHGQLRGILYIKGIKRVTAAGGLSLDDCCSELVVR